MRLFLANHVKREIDNKRLGAVLQTSFLAYGDLLPLRQFRHFHTEHCLQLTLGCGKDVLELAPGVRCHDCLSLRSSLLGRVFTNAFCCEHTHLWQRFLPAGLAAANTRTQEPFEPASSPSVHDCSSCLENLHMLCRLQRSRQTMRPRRRRATFGDEQAEGKARVPLAIENSISKSLCCSGIIVHTARRLRMSGMACCYERQDGTYEDAQV